MDLKQCQEAALRLDREYMKPYCSFVTKDENGKTLAHLRWMARQIQTPVFTLDKAMRWLGYIQGSLVARGALPLEVMKDVNNSVTGKQDAWETKAA